MAMKKPRGIDLLHTDDLEMEMVEVLPESSHTAIPMAARRAIIIERAEGVPVELIAVRYDCSPSTVYKIWKDFIQENAGGQALESLPPEEFKTQIRRKAIKAVENGLECERDPYRQGALGVQVMKGIGEFKSDQGSEGTKVNILINSVPGDWKQRYIGAGTETK